MCWALFQAERKSEQTWISFCLLAVYSPVIIEKQQTTNTSRRTGWNGKVPYTTLKQSNGESRELV